MKRLVEGRVAAMVRLNPTRIDYRDRLKVMGDSFLMFFKKPIDG